MRMRTTLKAPFASSAARKKAVGGPQVVIAMAVTRERLPVRSWVFPGNTTDVGTVGKVRSDLRGWNLNRAIFVADAGKNSPAHVENTFLQPVWPKATGSNRMSLADGVGTR